VSPGATLKHHDQAPKGATFFLTCLVWVPSLRDYKSKMENL
jgi:hypothetical protein